jgi:hypothetical protein
MAARAGSTPRELILETKATIKSMANIGTHVEAVRAELDPQLWSAHQPWAAERLAALQAKISKK